MAHYVYEMNSQAADYLYESGGAQVIHNWKKELRADKFILNAGNPTAISANDLLWQAPTKYDEIGHAYHAWYLWHFIVAHPQCKSAAFKVGGKPRADKQKELNNKLLMEIAGPFLAYFSGGNSVGDGFVFPLEKANFSHKLFPLEVGDVSPETLMYHCEDYRGFARWPYGFPFIYLFQVPTDFRHTSRDYLVWEHLRDCKECSKFGPLDMKEPCKDSFLRAALGKAPIDVKS